jgi:hypothetical protein
MNRCFILYHLTLATLPILVVARLFYHDLRFIRCSARIKRNFSSFVIRLGAKQLTEHKYYKESNFQISQKLCIDLGRRNRDRNHRLATALANYGGEPGYSDLLCRVFNLGWFRFQYMIPYAISGINDLAERHVRIDFLSAHPSSVFCWPETTTKKLHILKFHRPFIAPFQYILRAIFILILAIFPVLNAIKYLQKGITPRFRSINSRSKYKNVLFIHRYANMEQSGPRDIYLFHAGVLKVSDCAHYPMATSQGFRGGKENYLESNGGEVIRNRDINPSLYNFLNQVFFQYYTKLFPAIFQIFNSPDFNILSFRQLLEHLHIMPLASMLLDYCQPKVVYVETEIPPAANIIAVEARKREIQSISMIHGSGAQKILMAGRADLQFGTLLTPGKDNSVLKSINPRINNIVGIGNHEIDMLYQDTNVINDNILPDWVRKNRNKYKIVSCFLYLKNGFIDTSSLHGKTNYLDDQIGHKHTERNLKPLFDWIARRDDVIFVWKPKGTDRSILDYHPWIAPLIEKIPPERFIVLPEKSIAGVVAVSDVCICNNASSVIASSMAFGKPTISLDSLFLGWTKNYHPLMAANSGKELVSKLDQILEHGFPNQVYEKFNANWYADGIVDFKTNDRLAALFEPFLRNGK